MTLLIWIGTLATLAGLGGIVWVLISAIAIRRAGLQDEALKARLTRLVPINLGAFLLSFVGLMLVVVGVFLG